MLQSAQIIAKVAELVDALDLGEAGLPESQGFNYLRVFSVFLV
jgi:hypothetical protein